MPPSPTTEPARPRGALSFLSVWALLQLPRFIALPLIADALRGTESEAWMYPAILDIVVAVAAIPVAWLLVRRRGLVPFVLGIVFFVVSIIDHGDAITAGLMTPAPAIFGGPNTGFPPAAAPAIQSVGDVAALLVLTSTRVRAWLLPSR